MKAFLMYRDRDFDLQQPLPPNDLALTQDLELKTLFKAMALDDDLVFQVVRRAVLSGLSDPGAIRYRQDVLKDCLKHPAIIREMYRISIESITNKRKRWLGIFSRSPSGVLYSAIEMLEMFVELLQQLRHIADEHAEKFESEGLATFFAMIEKELDDDYFAVVQNHLKELKFRDGVLLSVELGAGNEGRGYILGRPRQKKNWIQRVLARSPVYSFSISLRDDHGARVLGDLKDRGLNLAANALAQAADHIDNFFEMLRIELAFYIGCLNLHERLVQLGEPVCFPQAVAANERRHSFHGLYDICLALTMKRQVVGNEVDADHKDLVIVTGANQGGKSTFLRSIGLAQLMMQSGMFAPAESLCANVCAGLFTHYKRKEDASMKSGKLDEELNRMSDIVDMLSPHSVVLFNESFAATNEREGSEIARQIVSALLEKRIKVFFVTHQYEFARGFHSKRMKNALFLRAQRKSGGGRTFKVVEGEPLQTSYGKDLYTRIFETDGQQSVGESAVEPVSIPAAR
ncbi:MAG: DNA mismatch repair protein MutS [Anaerolineae bacterium]|nr:DNA mismatch repair protein MutS [Anaerolineae bacterium]